MICYNTTILYALYTKASLECKKMKDVFNEAHTEPITIQHYHFQVILILVINVHVLRKDSPNTFTMDSRSPTAESEGEGVR